MPHKNKGLIPANKTERRFFEALERLKHGEPQNKKLAKLQHAGNLRINFTTVALEAGLSRRLIAMEKNCPYRNARCAVLAEMQVNQGGEPTTKRDVVRLLREQAQLLRMQLKQRDTENAALVRRMRKIETNARAEISEARRLAKRDKRPSDEIAGGKFNKDIGQVVDFPKQKEKAVEETGPTT